MDVQLKRGMLEVLALSTLTQGPSYGYAMLKSLGGCIQLNESTLYPILKRLEATGAVSVENVEHNGRLRRYYSVTDTGRRRIGAFLEEWGEVMKVYEFIRDSGGVASC